jgi:hypothetical protein
MHFENKIQRVSGRVTNLEEETQLHSKFYTSRETGSISTLTNREQPYT